MLGTTYDIYIMDLISIFCVYVILGLSTYKFLVVNIHPEYESTDYDGERGTITAVTFFMSTLWPAYWTGVIIAIIIKFFQLALCSEKE